jgi:diaminopimelate decarboxylase
MKLENKNENLVTPCYVIDIYKFRKNIEYFRKSFCNEWGNNILIGYSVKTNHSKDLIKEVRTHNYMVEVVSEDEYNYVLNIGYSPDNIIYNGPDKGEKSMFNALKLGGILNLDNFSDINFIINNRSLFDSSKCLIGLRVNFDLEHLCKEETTAGENVSRFGLCVENGDFEKALSILNKNNINLDGLHLHYSTKTRSLFVFKSLAQKAKELVLKYKIKNEVKFIDIGGGFWGGRVLSGKPTMKEYAEVICSELRTVFTPGKVTLILEPGASIIATAVDYLTKVRNVREIRNTKVITVDGSSLDINPLMFDRIPEYCLNIKDKRKMIPKQIICGSTCMEHDRFINLSNQIELKERDLITFYNAGAYTMCFNNCFINLPPNLYLKEGDSYLLLKNRSETELMEII